MPGRTGSKGHRLRENVVSQPFPEGGRSAYVDLHAQGFFEFGTDGQDLEVSSSGCELDEEVDVAAWPLVPASHRAEDGKQMPLASFTGSR